MNKKPIYAMFVLVMLSLLIVPMTSMKTWAYADFRDMPADQDLADRAGYVVIGQVNSVTSSWSDDRTMIYSYVGVSVKNYLKGAPQGKEIVIRVLGGEVGDIGLGVSSEPRFAKGEKVKAFLSFENDYFTVVGGQQGKISLESVTAASGSFSYSGIHWADSDIPVEYYISTTIPSSWIPAIQQSFQTWEDDPESYMDYTYMGTTTKTKAKDYVNVVSYEYIDGVGNTLARTTYWYWTATLLLFDTDIVFDTSETWSTTGGAGAYDVQNLGTHEVGHTLVLNDLYAPADSEETMYGYIAKGEIKKRTLEAGDIKGIRLIYGYKWPMFRHDPRHTGYSLSSAPTTNATLWDYTTGTIVSSSPAVADGKVFVGTFGPTPKVMALNEFTGASIWNYTPVGKVGSSPAVADGMVFVGAWDNKVYALNETTGASIWNYTTGGQVWSSPAVADGMVFIGSYDNKIYALDESTGALVWSFTTGDRVYSSPAVADGMVFVGSVDNKVYALNETTGAHIWSYTTGFWVFSSPAVADGMVFIGSHDYKVYALNETTGALVWSYTTGGEVQSSPAVADGMVFVGAWDNKVYALNETTGALVWSFTTGAQVSSSPAVADGMVFIGSHEYDYKVYALNETTGALVWSYTTGGRVESSPAVADGMVFIGSHDSKVYAFGTGPPPPPPPPSMFWKANFTDYAPSGMPDFDQRQDLWTNPLTGAWTWCGPLAMANSLWWFDSKFEPNPVPPPTINDGFPLVTAYGAWDDHDPLNVEPFVNDLAWFMDTDGQRTGLNHNGTKVYDMEAGVSQYLQMVGLNPVGDANGDGVVDVNDETIIVNAIGSVPGDPNWDLAADLNGDNIVDAADLDIVLIHLGETWGKFYEETVKMPTFGYIAEQVVKSEDVVILLGFWQNQDGVWVRVGGHFVTVPGVNPANLTIAFSDPIKDNAELGFPGRVTPPPPHPHNPAPPHPLHNNASYVSHDLYSSGASPSPGGEWGPEGYEVEALIENFLDQNIPDEFDNKTGPYKPGFPISVEVEYAVIVSPTPPPPSMFWKANFTDYAPSGMPDFDQKQDAWWPAWLPSFNWSWCAPVAVANSIWWYDSKYENSTIPPPTGIDNFPLVTAYGPWDDHDPQNVQPLVEHLAYLMDTDGQRTGILDPTTKVEDMQTGLAQYLSWTGVNPQGDVNGDGIVDQTDYNLTLAANGSTPGQASWNMAADIWPVTTGWPSQSMADNIVDNNDLNLVTANMNKTGMFYEITVPMPDFYFIEEEVEKSEDVVLTLGFYIEVGPGEYNRVEEPYPYGHAITVAGINSTTLQIAISDPAIDAFELGLTLGRSPVPHTHLPPEPPYVTHNNASLVSHDIYNVTFNGLMGMWELVGYPQLGPGIWHVLIENAVITSPLEIHDVAVTNLNLEKTVVSQNYTMSINVTVVNEGGFTETFTVTTYYSPTISEGFADYAEFGPRRQTIKVRLDDIVLVAPGTPIETKAVTLTSGNSTTITFTWNTTGVAKGNYTISAVADTVPGETDTADNTYIDGIVTVTIAGDTDGDGDVDFDDFIVLAGAFGSNTGHPAYDARADFDNDGDVDFDDFIVLAGNYGNTV